ncbi:MAG TPA: hypothetical protein VLA98_03095 [Solirubrobacteraceae bacterium]|nr:hypothetical protein [Solirubrobacteraceae bacterium]
MRRAALLLALVVAGVVAGGVWAIVRSHDTPPDDVEACATPHGAKVARGEEGLGFAREDIRARTLRVARRYRLHDDAGVLLAGTGYRVLVVGVADGPSLSARGLPMRVYRRTAEFARVLTERDPVRALDRCARAASG